MFARNKNLPKDITYHERFKVEKKLARTLQGYIYLARDRHDGNKLRVIKETKIALVKSGKTHDGQPVAENFEEERQILLYLTQQPDVDPGFAQILCHWKTKKCYYYAMEHCEAELFKHISGAFSKGGTMYNILVQQKSRPQVALTSNDAHQWLAEVRSIFRQCVKTVYWMHEKGVCHLDLSLENTMIYKVKGLKIKIIDFGLGKFYDYNNPAKPKDALFQNDKKVGKRGYMAPEVFNKQIYDARKADIWSLGMFFMDFWRTGSLTDFKCF